MTALTKLLLPLGIGIAAAALNYWLMSRVTSPRDFVVVTQRIEAGQLFERPKLGTVRVSGDLDQFSKSALSPANLSVILNRPAPRTMEPGDVVLWRDASPPPQELAPGDGEHAMPISLQGVDIVPELLLVGQYVGFFVAVAPEGAVVSPGQEPADVEIEYVGPFRVLSVGGRLSRTAEEMRSSSSSDGDKIIVAIRLGPGQTPDASTAKLIQAEIPDLSGRSNILKIILHSGSVPHSAETTARVEEP